MTWDWLPFLVGAPILASVGIVMFASLTAAEDRSARTSRKLAARIADQRRAAEDPTVVSLSRYRLERARRPGPLRGGTAQGHS